MQRINLLPREVIERRRARRTALALSGGVAGLVGMLLVFYLIQTGRLAGARGDLDDQRAQNRQLQSQVDQLSRFSQLRADLATKQQLLSALTEGEVRWSVILSDLATVIPAEVWVTNFTGSVQLASGATTGPGGRAVTPTFGQIQLSGCTLTPPDGTHLEVAKLLVRLGVPREFIEPYLSLSSKGGPECPVNYNATLKLSDSALRKSQRGGERAP